MEVIGLDKFGATSKKHGKYENRKREFGLRGDVVLQLIDIGDVPPLKRNKIFDNYFIYLKLLTHL